MMDLIVVALFLALTAWVVWSAWSVNRSSQSTVEPPAPEVDTAGFILLTDGEPVEEAPREDALSHFQRFVDSQAALRRELADRPAPSLVVLSPEDEAAGQAYWNRENRWRRIATALSKVAGTHLLVAAPGVLTWSYSQYDDASGATCAWLAEGLANGACPPPAGQHFKSPCFRWTGDVPGVGVVTTLVVGLSRTSYDW